MFRISEDTFQNWLKYKRGDLGYRIEYFGTYINEDHNHIVTFLIEDLSLKERGSSVRATKFSGHQCNFYTDADIQGLSYKNRGDFFITCRLRKGSDSWVLRNTSWFTITSQKKQSGKVRRWRVQAESRALRRDVKMYVGYTFELVEDYHPYEPDFLRYGRIYTYWSQTVPEITTQWYKPAGAGYSIPLLPLMFDEQYSTQTIPAPLVREKIDAHSNTLDILWRGLRDIQSHYLFLFGVPEVSESVLLSKWDKDMLLSHRPRHPLADWVGYITLDDTMVEDFLMRDYTELDRLHSGHIRQSDLSKDDSKYHTTRKSRLGDTSDLISKVRQELTFGLESYLEQPDSDYKPFHYKLNGYRYNPIVPQSVQYSRNFFSQALSSPTQSDSKSIYRVELNDFTVPQNWSDDLKKSIKWSIQWSVASSDATLQGGTYSPFIPASINQDYAELHLLTTSQGQTVNKEVIKQFDVDALPVQEAVQEVVQGDSMMPALELDTCVPGSLYYQNSLNRKYTVTVLLPLVPFIELYDIVKLATPTGYIYGQVIEKQESDSAQTMELKVETTKEVFFSQYD